MQEIRLLGRFYALHSPLRAARFAEATHLLASDYEIPAPDRLIHPLV